MGNDYDNEPDLRVTALSLALQRARDGEKPDETVARADVFLTFLAASDMALEKEQAYG
jgi:hypothetical protein